MEAKLEKAAIATGSSGKRSVDVAQGEPTEEEHQVKIDSHLGEETNGFTSHESEPLASREPVSQLIFSEAQGDELFATEVLDGVENLTLKDLKDAVEVMDDNIDEALGHAADSIWNFATTVTGKVTTAVKEGQPGLESLRKNVTSRLAPLDKVGRELTSQIGAFAQNDQSIASIAGSVKSVAASVQRNAEAMEAAILAKANNPESLPNDGADAADDVVHMSDPAVGVIPMGSTSTGGVESTIDVNEEIAKVGETISNSIVGQTVGGLWTGLWGNLGRDDEWDGVDIEENMPKNRFEQRIFELQANPDTYCEPAKDLDAFEAWSGGFVLDDHADTCIAILDMHSAIAELYERVVPRIVDEDTFWMRYFFARYVLEQDEERRKKLLERAVNAVVEEDNDEGWGDDDWDDGLQVKTDTIQIPSESVKESEVPIVVLDEISHAKGEKQASEAGNQEKKQRVAVEVVRVDKEEEKKPTREVDQVSTQGCQSAQMSPTAGGARVEGGEDWSADDWE